MAAESPRDAVPGLGTALASRDFSWSRPVWVFTGGLTQPKILRDVYPELESRSGEAAGCSIIIKLPKNSLQDFHVIRFFH